MLDFFEFVLGSDDLRNGKPHPKMYLTATERLGETSQKCLAIEDSDNGVLAAFEAELTVIRVPDLEEPSAEIKAIGHNIASSLVEVRQLLS